MPARVPTFRHLLTSIVILMISAGCREAAENETLRDLGSTLNESYEHTKRQLQPKAEAVTTYAGSELEKLFSFEYKVVDLTHEQSAVEIESSLNALGRERWDCFSVQPRDFGLRLTCKRAPKTVLKYIPRMF